jgi:Ca-activated chloride channel family protein
MSVNKFKYNLGNAFLIILIIEVIFWALAIASYRYLAINVEEFRFERTYVLYGLLFIPFAIIIYFYSTNWKNKSLKSYASEHLLKYSYIGISSFKSITKFILVRLGLSFILIAMANPQYGENEKIIESKGIDIMIAIDVSNSMLAEDLANNYSRLKIAKLSIEKLFDKLHGDRIGIVVFAGDAYKQVPITPDYHVAKMFLKNISTGMISSQGTNIGLALEKCVSSFNLEDASNKAIIVFSDGEDHEMEGINAAKEAAEKGIKVYTIGMGTKSGVPIPIYRNGIKTGTKKDQEGNTVLTKLNEKYLIDISENGEGSYTRANGLNVGIDGIVNQLNSIEKTTMSQEKYTGYDDQFQPYLLIGLLLLLIDFFISDKRNKLNEKFNLFKNHE